MAGPFIEVTAGEYKGKKGRIDSRIDSETVLARLTDNRIVGLANWEYRELPKRVAQ